MALSLTHEGVGKNIKQKAHLQSHQLPSQEREAPGEVQERLHQ